MVDISQEEYKTFIVTKEHLKLLRHFQVGWQDCETGAPEIDPKRPYGNSDVPQDIYEILHDKRGKKLTSKEKELTEEEKKSYLKLHLEMEIVLQIILSIGAFEAGEYRCKKYSTNWEKVLKNMSDNKQTKKKDGNIIKDDRCPSCGESL